MKTGRSITELAIEIERQQNAKKDFVASTANIDMVGANGGEISTVVNLQLGGSKGPLLQIGDTAHTQIAAQAEIPKPYYDRMLNQQPALLASNVNTWLHAKPEKRLLRTLDGKARALLSDRYRALDNAELAEAALPVLMDRGLEIASCEITERRLYIKAFDRRVTQFIPGGHRMGDGSHVGFKVPNGVICPAIQISNSEIGYGALSIERGYLDGGCTNLMWQFRKNGLRKHHVGGRLEVGDDLYRMLTDETRAATDKAIWLQFRDTIKASLSEEGFGEYADVLREAAGLQIESKDVEAVVEVTAKKFTLTEGVRKSVLQHLIQGGDLSKFGLANAVTSAANDHEDYDTATDLEALGGKIIELPKSEWREISNAELKRAA